MSKQLGRTTLSQLTSSVEGSLVRTSPSQERGKASKESAQGCGLSMPESFASYDHNTLSWKTCQHSLFGGLTELSESWPASGMIRNGRAYRLQLLVPHTEDGGRLYWPTPTANKSILCSLQAGIKEAKRLHPAGKWTLWTRIAEEAWGRGVRSGFLNPTWVEWLMGFPIGWTELES